MSFLKKIFGLKKDEGVTTYSQFWRWFYLHEKEFYEIVKGNHDVSSKFLNKLSSKLQQLDGKFFFLTGMYDLETVELIFTAEGNIKDIPFVEDLVDNAPSIKGWRFTALKPAREIADINMKMNGFRFDKNNISFYSNDTSENVDEINITVVHDQYTEENKEVITNGTYIFLDNVLGELKFASAVDNISIISPRNNAKKLIPIEKLNDFITWRQKEFSEKYEGIWHDSEADNYSILKAKTTSGNGIVAVVNTDLLKWEAKASHPWMILVEIKYDGIQNHGMPDTKTAQVLNEIGKEIDCELKSSEGYLNIVRETGNNTRSIYIACKDFRKPSKILTEIIQKHPIPEINYDIFKDKYWHSINRFKAGLGT